MQAAHFSNWEEELVGCIHHLHRLGFAPATSSNYSFKRVGEEKVCISSSGLDKGYLRVKDLMWVDLQGQAIQDHRRPSAETLLHTTIYQSFPAVQCVLHTHTIHNTILSKMQEGAGSLQLAGFELLKALEGIDTHEVSVDIPILENSQDMEQLSEKVKQLLRDQPETKAFLLSGHGLYTWGKSIASAKRQVEALEFLFECDYKIKLLNKR